MAVSVAQEDEVYMDRLARNAMLAKQAGMSYGKWKAMQEPVKVDENYVPEGWRKCEYCGKAFKKANGKRFCDISCREKAYEPRYRERKLEYMRKYRERNGFRE